MCSVRNPFKSFLFSLRIRVKQSKKIRQIYIPLLIRLYFSIVVKQSVSVKYWFWVCVILKYID